MTAIFLYLFLLCILTIGEGLNQQKMQERADRTEKMLESWKETDRLLREGRFPPPPPPPPDEKIVSFSFKKHLTKEKK